MPTSSLDSNPPQVRQEILTDKNHPQSKAATPAQAPDLQTSQLYVLSSRKHRDAIQSALHSAKSERDRANAALFQATQWLASANANVTRLEGEYHEAREEYLHAKGVFAKQFELTNIRMDESENEDGNGGSSKKRARRSEGRYKKSPLITDLLMDMAKSGQLEGGKKLSECVADVNPRDKAKFVSSMDLVQELWTEEEELFLRSPPSEIAESLEELKIIVATIGERCLAKLCEWEGREDTGRQKPSVITVGIRARKAFMARAEVAKEGGGGGDEDDGMEENVEEAGDDAVEKDV